MRNKGDIKLHYYESQYANSSLHIIYNNLLKSKKHFSKYELKINAHTYILFYFVRRSYLCTIYYTLHISLHLIYVIIT